MQVEDLGILVTEFLEQYHWDSPFTFIVVFLAGLVFLRRWSMFLLVLVTVVLGWGAQDMMITNVTTGDNLVSAPLIIYAVGSVTLVILSLWSFYKS